MIKKIGKISPDTLEDLRELGTSIMPLMEHDHSNYARGRKRIWLFHEINLKTSEVTAGYFNERLWNLAQRFGCDIGLMSYGGKSLDSTGLISYHRDHSYAMSPAFTINLGQAIFGYDLNRQGGDKRNFQLNDGDIIQFDCKHLHSLVEIQSEIRFGINFWKLNEAKGFKPLI